MKKIKCSINIIIAFLIVTITLFFIPTNTYARYVECADTSPGSSSETTSSGVINPGDFKPPELTEEDTEIVTSKASIIINIIEIMGAIGSVIALMIIGIKFMLGSVEEKADYKKSMIHYIIGVFIFFTITRLLRVVIKIVEEFNV